MSGVNLGSSPATLYLGETPISTGSGTILPKTITENGTYNASADSADGYSPVTVNVAQPVITTATAAADLTGYSGNPDLGNGFEVTTSGGSGTIAVDSETIGGVTYNGLRISGGTTIRNKKNFGKMSTLEIEFIVDSFVSGANRLISTGGGFDFSVYISDDDYLHYVADQYYQVLDPAVDLIPYSGGNCNDNSITKASLIGAVTNIKFVDDGTRVTLYVNGVAKVNWKSTEYANSIFYTYGLNVGANGVGGADMLITKLQWTANGIEYDGRNWVPV